ncbi:hypothetical protein M3Y94_00673100 [Aphelenchoides besseyi]|nr:hypothetical protein M3Y94_00673100 [Aphelenchoides besseyi]
MAPALTWDALIGLAKNTLRATESAVTYDHFLRLFRKDFSIDFEIEAQKFGFITGIEALSTDVDVTINRNGTSIIVCCLSRRTLERLNKKGGCHRSLSTHTLRFLSFLIIGYSSLTMHYDSCLTNYSLTTYWLRISDSSD